MTAMDRSSVDWHGYIPAMVTPFARDGDLDRDGFSQLLEWLIGEGMHGIVVAGSSGEWFSLDPDERIELFSGARAVLALVDATDPLVVQEGTVTLTREGMATASVRELRTLFGQG